MEPSLKADILIYIAGAESDDELTFNGVFLPVSLAASLGALENAGSIYYSAPPAYRGRLSEIPGFSPRDNESDDAGFWKDLFERTGSGHLCKIHAEAPFLDSAIINEMIDIHLRYLAEFTFSENMPAGFSCEIVSKELIASIPDFSEKTLPLGQVVRSNINNFDIEIYYRDPDIRDKRISFLSSDPRDARIMENMHRLHASVPPYGEIRSLIEKSPGVLYIGPSYLELELTGRCDLECLFCYRSTLKKTHKDMDASLFSTIIGQMNGFNLPYTICFGGSGEPLMHGTFFEILAEANRQPLVKSVIVETNGILAGPNYLNAIAETGGKTTTIVNINGIDSETYARIHGHDFYSQVVNNIIALKEISQGRLYVQVMKINETEPFLDSYYDYWEGQGIPVILQKQNTFLGRIPDRRYSDLSPLARTPCWHLQRDIYILSDGTVPFCKQDVDGDYGCSSLRDSTLAGIWEDKREAFIRDYGKDFPAAPDCQECDEWYTYNF